MVKNKKPVQEEMLTNLGLPEEAEMPLEDTAPVEETAPEPEMVQEKPMSRLEELTGLKSKVPVTERTQEPQDAPQSRPLNRMKPSVGTASNPAALTFPSDIYGLTGKLKKEMIAVSSRINGDPAKLQLVKDTLKLLMQHMHARFNEYPETAGGLKPKVKADVEN